MKNRIVHCWASFNETLPPEEYYGQADKLCMLEDGHSGDHEWVPTSDIVIKFDDTPEPK